MIFVLFMLLTGTTLIGLFRTLSKPGKTVKEQASDSYNRARVRRVTEAQKPRFVDISVDDIPEERETPEPSDQKGKRLIDAYNSADNDFEVKSVNTNDISNSVGSSDGSEELPPSLS